jgi:hypothetical protein
MSWSSHAWRLALAVLLLTAAWQVYALRSLPAWCERQIAREGDRTREAALAAVADTAERLNSEIAAARRDVLASANAQINATRRDLLAEVQATLARADRAVAVWEQLREEVRPLVADADQTLLAAHASIVQIRPEALGLVAAAKVTAGETAQTMRTVRDAAPSLAQSVESVSTSAAGIAGDVKRAADAATRPKRWWEKVLGPVYTAAKLITLFF